MMEVSNLILSVRNLNDTSEIVSLSAFEYLKKYLSNPLLNHKSGSVIKILKRIENQSEQGVELAVRLLEEIRGKNEINSNLERLVNELRIERKELKEAAQFYTKVSYLFQENEYIVDFCSGNGLNGIYWYVQGSAKKVDMVDIVESKDYRRLVKGLEEDFPDIRTDLNYSIEGIEKYRIGERPDLITAVHACGELTDKIIELAIKNRINFAVMPCCYEFKKERILPKEILAQLGNKKECVDAVRSHIILNSGFKLYINEIDREVSPYNRIIIGEIE